MKGHHKLTVWQESIDYVKNPVREHGASSMEKAIYLWGLIAPKPI
jgi:hypothetical protein